MRTNVLILRTTDLPIKTTVWAAEMTVLPMRTTIIDIVKTIS